MQFPLDFQVTRVENGMGVEETSVITSVQLQEYGMYTLNYTDASVPVAMCMCSCNTRRCSLSQTRRVTTTTFRYTL